VSFKEILGQEKAVFLLKSAVRQNRVSHAYLFVGPAGVGKSAAALNFARLLFCESVSAGDVEPCDECPSCRKAAAGSHPDIQVLSPDGAFTRIDAVREACRRLSLKGFESMRKALIVSEAGTLNEESSNALLKTLEEPSAGTVIILLADSLKSVLPTIASRCQRIVFSPLKDAVLQAILLERYGMGREEARYLARLSEGCMEKALKFHKEEIFKKRDAFLEGFLQGRMPVVEGKKAQEESFDTGLFLLAGWLRDLLVAKVNDEEKNFVNADRKDDIMLAARGLKPEEIDETLRSVADTAADLRHNVNRRVAFARLNTELWKSLRKSD